MILGLNHLSFCAVAGLTSLLRARDVAQQRHIHLHLVSGPQVERLLRLTGLHDRFLAHPRSAHCGRRGVDRRTHHDRAHHDRLSLVGRHHRAHPAP